MTRISDGLSGVGPTFFWVLYSVKTTLLAHTRNDLFDQIWRNGVSFGTFVQNFQPPPPATHTL